MLELFNISNAWSCFIRFSIPYYSPHLISVDPLYSTRTSLDVLLIVCESFQRLSFSHRTFVKSEVDECSRTSERTMADRSICGLFMQSGEDQCE